MKRVRIFAVALMAAACSSAALDSRDERTETTTQAVTELPPPPVQLTPLPPPAPIPRLTLFTLDAFLARAEEASTREESEAIRAEIKRARDNIFVAPALYAELGRRLLALPTNNPDRLITVLQVIGEMRNPASLLAINALVWSPISLVVEPPAPTSDVEDEDGDDLTPTDSDDVSVRMMAVEMMAWIGGPQADGLVKLVVAAHPQRAVRSAAVNAFLYNKGDSEAAKNELRALVQPIDRFFVDRIRLTPKSAASGEFDRKLVELYSPGGPGFAELPADGDPDEQPDSGTPAACIPGVICNNGGLR